MIKIGRAIEGVSINGKEWLLDEENNIITFPDRKAGKKFLTKNGFESFTDEELEDSFFYEEVES